jgi:hypothetical protein
MTTTDTTATETPEAATTETPEKESTPQGSTTEGTSDKKPTKKKASKKKAKRTRKPLNYVLGWVNETGDFDGEGKIVPGTEQEVFVRMPMPPGLDEAGARNRESIERACRRAVYDLGMEEYGNKEFIVIAHGDRFSIPCERVQITRLLPPEKAEKVREKNGKGIVDVTVDTEPTTSDEQEDDEV